MPKRKLEITFARLDKQAINGIYHFNDGAKVFFCEGKGADIVLVDHHGNRCPETPDNLRDPHFTEAWNYTGGASRPMLEADIAEWEHVMERKMQQ